MILVENEDTDEKKFAPFWWKDEMYLETHENFLVGNMKLNTHALICWVYLV